MNNKTVTFCRKGFIYIKERNACAWHVLHAKITVFVVFAFRSLFHHLCLKSVYPFSVYFTASRDTELLFECTYVPVLVTAFALREIGPTSPMKFATFLIEGF